MELAQVSRILGGQKVLGTRLRSRMDLVELAGRGLTKDAVSKLAGHLSLSLKDMAGLLPITERSLQRYGPRKPLNRTVSEQVLQIAEVAARGAEVFGEKERFLAWANQPSTALADKTPLELLGSRYGTELVLDELGRIEHGIVS
jgi:putative toxin-antitoxin system antitoxin component (TIGR02293 family)